MNITQYREGNQLMNYDIQLLNRIKNYLNKQKSVEVGNRINATAYSSSLIIKWNDSQFKITVEKIIESPLIKQHPEKECVDCGIYHTSYNLQITKRSKRDA